VRHALRCAFARLFTVALADSGTQADVLAWTNACGYNSFILT
jgi:hypothetical protein